MVKVVYDDVWSFMIYGHLRHDVRVPGSMKYGPVFFIRTDSNSCNPEIVPDDLPSFINTRVAQNILFSGQLVNHFKQTMNDEIIPRIFKKSIDILYREMSSLKKGSFDVRKFNLFIEKIRRQAARVCNFVSFYITPCPIRLKFGIRQSVGQTKWLLDVK